MDDPLRLTFGIELECIVRYDPSIYESGLAHGDGILWLKGAYLAENRLAILARHHMVNVIRSEGHPTYELRESGLHKWTVATESSIEIDTDRPFDGYNYCDVEIKSPAYDYSVESLVAVQEVIHLLTREFDVILNETCGLHVHVGNQRKGFPLQTLKNFSILTTIFEPQLNSLHPPERVAGPDPKSIAGNEYTKCPTSAYKGTGPWDTALLIQECKTKQELVLRHQQYPGGGYDRFFAYNLGHQVFDNRKLNTIEFRQHRATLDTREIATWVRLTCGLVNYAHNADFEDITRLIDDCALDSNFFVAHLLSMLRLNDIAKYYDVRGCWLHERPDWAWVDYTFEHAKELDPSKCVEEYVNGKKVVRTVAKTAPESKLSDNQPCMEESGWHDPGSKFAEHDDVDTRLGTRDPGHDEVEQQVNEFLDAMLSKQEEDERLDLEEEDTRLDPEEEWRDFEGDYTTQLPELQSGQGEIRELSIEGEWLGSERVHTPQRSELRVVNER
ncbi:hypothetical protein MMC28_007631 [Mycoblastus sanguinarius]|nr:hypothetical protein [Mycoblastus sanguinarius]